MSHCNFRKSGLYCVGAGGRNGGPAGRRIRGRGGWTASRWSAAERRSLVSGHGGGAGFGPGVGKVECSLKSSKKKRKKRRMRLVIPL